ncbi:MAG TPA: type 4a pilus biogenesis protein PilO [Vicinamibacterales bacterium]|nr:type 4a pilus biogenesis protein PilO [Vicinamibacterales bacterium]
MNLSLSKLPWYWQIGAFVLVCGGAVFGFWNFYVAEMQSDLDMREARLSALRKDIEKGVATARQLPEFQAQVDELERRLDSLRAVLPEEKDVADILRRVQGLAAQSSLSIQRFTPQAAVQQPLYAEVPIKLQAEGTYHNLGYFFDRIGKFPRIINIGEISIRPRSPQEPNATIVAECTATTFVLQEGPAGKGGRGGVPAQPGGK